MLALAKSLVIFLGLFFLISVNSARAQNWGQADGQYYGNNNQYGNQYNSQFGNQYNNSSQGQYQTPYSAPNQPQGQSTYYGQAQQSQGMNYGNGTGGFPTTTGGYNNQQPQGNEVSTGSPGSFMESSPTDFSQNTNTGQSGFVQENNGGVSGGTSGGGGTGSKLKGAGGAMASILGKAASVAAPVAGAYMFNKAAQRNGGYYQPNPYYGGYGGYGTPYGANPYYGNAYGNPYGSGYGYGGYGNPYYGNGGGYYPQQTMGNSFLNTGLRALFGY